MKRTLQKKLDELGDRLRSVKPTSTTYKVKGRIRSVKKGTPLVGYIDLKKMNLEAPYDLYQKGLKFDALKKRNNELLRILKELHNTYENALYNQPLWDKAKQLIKNK